MKPATFLVEWAQSLTVVGWAALILGVCLYLMIGFLLTQKGWTEFLSRNEATLIGPVGAFVILVVWAGSVITWPVWFTIRILWFIAKSFARVVQGLD